jgi:hypothetical protein
VQGAVPNSADGFGLATPDDARIGGDLATTSGFTLTIDGARGLSIGTESAGDAGNLLGGHSSNSVDPGFVGGTIGGGGFDDGNFDKSHRIAGDYGTIGGGKDNTVSGNQGTVGGGRSNTASGLDSTVGGGQDNTATSGSEYATVGGGKFNEASASIATVGGGGTNFATGQKSTIAGGEQNRARDSWATVAGGARNHAAGAFSTSAGGWLNRVHGDYDAVGGGQENRTGTSGMSASLYATVPGGRENVATGTYSFAAGRQAEAKHDGAFVWADSTSGSVTSTASKQFLVQAGGGVGVNTTSPEAPLDIAGGNFDLSDTEGDLKIGSDSHRLKFGIATSGGGAGDTHIRTESTNLNKLSLGVGTSDVVVINSGSVFPASDDTYSLGKSGSRWTSVYATNGTIQTSDARLKTNVADLDGGLEQVRAMRPVTYEWDAEMPEAQDEAETRIGLLAQEVADIVPEAVVESSDDGTMGLAYDMLIPVLIDAVSEQGETIEEQRTTVESLASENERLRAENEDLRERLEAVETHLGLDTGSKTPADD